MPPGERAADTAPGTLERLKRRPEFVAVARSGRRCAAPGLVLQVRRRTDASEVGAWRVGLTVSRKVGKAVTRNRARRRLRAVAREVLSRHAVPGHDYVLIGRAQTPTRPYRKLKADLERALKKVGAWRDQATAGTEPTRDESRQ